MSEIASATQRHDPLIVIAGPTASGKSSLALQFAEYLATRGKKAEILCADSITVYRGFEIGAAKPSEEDRALIPHHLVDIAEAAQDFTAGDFVRLAQPLIERMQSDGIVPIVAGGTGFYLRALLWGMAANQEQPPDAAEIKQKFEKRSQEEGWPALYEELLRLDPGAASTVHANDHYRVIRALQAIELYGRPWSELNRQARSAPTRYPGMRFFCLRLPQEELDARIRFRAQTMLAAGLLEEVRALLASGVSPDAKPMRSVGYKESIEGIRENWPLEKIEDAIFQATRRLAKQQMTWFRGERAVEWLEPEFFSNLQKALSLL